MFGDPTFVEIGMQGLKVICFLSNNCSVKTQLNEDTHIYYTIQPSFIIAKRKLEFKIEINIIISYDHIEKCLLLVSPLVVLSKFGFLFEFKIFDVFVRAIANHRQEST